MDDSQIFKQLEFYSNAIVAFIVIQSLAVCYNFGTSITFGRVLRTYKGLSIGLAIGVLLAMSLALYGNHLIGSKAQQLSSGHEGIMKSIYYRKAITIIIFSALQIVITVFYAVFGQVPNIPP